MNRTTTSLPVCSRETIHGSPVNYRNIFLIFIQVTLREARLGMQVATPLDPPLSEGQASTPQNRTYRV